MKRTVIPRIYATAAVISALMLSMQVNAQVVNVYQEAGGPVVNGTLVTAYGQPTDNIVQEQMPVMNNTGENVTVNVKRYELNVPSEITINYFCWGDCLIPDTTGDHPLWYALSPLDLQPGEVQNGFYADYKPLGVSGMACFRFVWFDVADTTDSVYVDLCFDVYEGAGIREDANGVDRFDLMPNPTSDGQVDLYLDLADATGREQLVLRDATGREAYRTRVFEGQRRMSLGNGALLPGIWHATLVLDGKPLATRRLVISGR